MLSFGASGLSSHHNTCAWRTFTFDVLPVRHATIGRQHATARSRISEESRKGHRDEQEPWRIPLTTYKACSQSSPNIRRGCRRSLQCPLPGRSERGRRSQADFVSAHEERKFLRLLCWSSYVNSKSQAETYNEWKAAATDLDVLEGNNAWKDEDESPEYNAALVAARLKELDDARLNCDVKKMLFLIRTTLTRGLGDMGDLRLYKHSHTGTKKLIERYIDSAQQTMTALLDVSAKQGDQCPVDSQTLVQQLVQARQSFGRSALLLSGGGTFGMNHIGVVKSLWDAGLLPRIISGASAGSIVCAVLCTKTDAEIPEVMHEFCYGDLDVFEKAGEPESALQKVVRLCQTGTLFDMTHLKRVMRQMLGDMTFQESYNRTRRILNIPVSTSSIYELPRLLNYITAPNVMIWSAV